jgi:hypothetical protein
MKTEIELLKQEIKVLQNKVEFLQSIEDHKEKEIDDFRQKLFDGIKSVFYDPEYERTHWKMKVNMAVDEVLTHFLEALPEPGEYIEDYGPSQEYVDGWNHYYEIIKEKLQGY